MNNELEPYRETIINAKTRAKNSLNIIEKIDSEFAVEIAKEVILNGKAKILLVEQTLASAIQSAHRAHAELTQLRKRLTDPIRDIVTRQQRILSDYANRIEAENRRKAEEQQRVLQQQAEELRLKQAAALEQKAERLESGQEPEFNANEAQMAAAQLRDRAENLLSAPISAPMVVAAKDPGLKSLGVSTTIVWKWEVADKKQIPLDYLMVDEVTINAIVRSQKSGCQIPGIRVYSETKANVRG